MVKNTNNLQLNTLSPFVVTNHIKWQDNVVNGYKKQNDEGKEKHYLETWVVSSSSSSLFWHFIIITILTLYHYLESWVVFLSLFWLSIFWLSLFWHIILKHGMFFLIVTILTLLCFGVAKLVPLCLDLCTSWLIIKCILNINLFNMIVVIIVSFTISLFLSEILMKGFKEGLWCEKDWAFSLPD